MKNKKGFTLIELLICIVLVSVVVVFLFRLINDIRNENTSSAYIKEVYMMRNEIMSKMNSIIVSYGICHSDITKEDTEVDVDLTLCNSEHLYLTVTDKTFTLGYDGDEQLYKIEDRNTYFDLNYVETNEVYQDYEIYTLSFPTHKKGVKDTVIDDISFSYSSIRNETNIKSKFSCTTCDCEFTADEDATYIVELWGDKGSDGQADVPANLLPQSERDLLSSYFGEAHPSECYYSSPNCSSDGYDDSYNDICHNKLLCAGDQNKPDWKWEIGGTCRCACGATIQCPSGFHGDGCSDCKKYYTTNGGLGGYTYGELQLKKGDKIFVGCALGADNQRGYGTVKGGDGVFIATEKIGNGTLEEYVNDKDKILLVAGGGGGASDCLPHPDLEENQIAASGKAGGSGKSVGTFGRGQYCSGEASFCGGNGGGGYYGGRSGSSSNYSCYNSVAYSVRPGGSGGSGYINSNYISNGIIYTSDDYTNNDKDFFTQHTDCTGYSQSKCANEGNHFVRISTGVLK